MKPYLIFCFAYLCTTSIIAQPWGQVHRTNASDIENSGELGTSVDISGRYAIAGAHFNEAIISGNEAFGTGAAYLYEQSANGRWREVQKLEASDRFQWDWFGWSVAIHGDHAIVGAPLEDSLNRNSSSYFSGAGAAYIFQRNGQGQWNQTAQLRAFDWQSGDDFGYSVAINNRYAVIGAISEDEDENGESIPGGFDAGSVYIYEKVGNAWTFRQKIIATDKGHGHRFGNDVALSKDHIIVGAPLEPIGPNDELHRDGAVYVFEYDDLLDQWVQSQKLLASDRIVDEKGYAFGYAVDLDGSRLVVGAPDWENPTLDDDTGKAYVFHLQGGTWVEHTQLASPDPQANEDFGFSVGISANLIVVSTPKEDSEEPAPYYTEDWGAAYLFQRNTVQDRWEFSQRIEANDAMEDDEFGYDVAIDQARTIVGMPKRDQTTQNPDDFFPNAGAVYFFEADGTILHLNPSIENSIDLKLSPNPASDQVLIEWDETQPLVQLRLLNQQGQVLRQNSRPNTPLQWQLDNLASGIYFIQTQTDTHSMLTKLVID